MQSQRIFNPYRKLVVGTDIKVPLSNGKYTKGINLDNAATTPPFVSVVKEINRFVPWYSSVHRGAGYKSTISTNIYEYGRIVIKNFINADIDDTVIYTKNTTDSINILSHVLSQKKDGKDIVLSTWMEHAANDLPWRDKFTVDYVEIDESGHLLIDDLKEKLNRYNGRVKLVTVTGASNVTGYINTIYEIAKLAHKYGAKVHVDAAQLVSHEKIDMKPFESDKQIDFISFSAHKMYAPFGIGILVGAKENFIYGSPYAQGGSAINLVTHSKIDWNDPPDKDEAGTPNLIGIISLIAAIKTFNSIGIKNVSDYEKKLYLYTYSKLKTIPNLTIYSKYDNSCSVGIIPFNMEGISHEILSQILSCEAGIAVRSGFFCAHPYCQRLLSLKEKDMDYYFENKDAPLPGLVRVSLGIYNTFEEIDILVNTLKDISEDITYYKNKYNKT